MCFGALPMCGVEKSYAPTCGRACSCARSLLHQSTELDENIFSGRVTAKFSIPYCLTVFGESVFPIFNSRIRLAIY